MRIFKYSDFINESLKQTYSSSFDQYKEIKEELIDMIEKSIGSDDDEMFNDFLSGYVKSPDETSIEGLINDSDVYDFYLKYRNDIDEILNEVKYFDDVPSEQNIYSLYDYIIKSTKRAIEELIKSIRQEIKG